MAARRQPLACAACVQDAQGTRAPAILHRTMASDRTAVFHGPCRRTAQSASWRFQNLLSGGQLFRHPAAKPGCIAEWIAHRPILGLHLILRQRVVGDGKSGHSSPSWPTASLASELSSGCRSATTTRTGSAGGFASTKRAASSGGIDNVRV
jgi:hypothetical protein